MRASNGRTAVLALAVTLGAGPNVSAHRTEDYLQAARIGLDPDGVVITLDLTPGIVVAEAFIAALDHDRDGTLSTAEQRRYARRVVRALKVEIDERPLQPRAVSWSFPEPPALRRGEGTVRLKILAALPGISAGVHRLFFGNAHLAGHSVYLANALVPESARLAVTAQRRTGDQSELTIEYTVYAVGTVSRRSIVCDELAAPALDRGRHLPERAALGGQRVLDAHRRAGLDITRHEAAGLELLETRGKCLGPHPARALFEGAEPQRPALEQAQDEPGPGAREQVHRVLEGPAVGIDALAHPPELYRKWLSTGKRLDRRNHKSYHWYLQGSY